MEKRGKHSKAQMKISFQLIFAIILIIIFIAFGFFGIKKFIEIQENIQAKKLVSDIQGDINRILKSPKASYEKKFTVPKKIESVIFEEQPLEAGNPNIYSLPLGIVQGNLSGVNWFKTNPSGEKLSVEVEDRKLWLRFEKDYGEKSVSISKGGEFIPEELISEPGIYKPGIGGSGIGSISREELLNNLPLKISSSGRYLEIQNGKPFLLNGDTAWSLIVQLSKGDADYYLQERAESGFNTIAVMLIAHNQADNAPENYDGVKPFTGRVFTTPNEEYFEHVDYVLDSARDKGFIVLLAPSWLGWDCSQEGWCSDIKQASENDILEWGRYLGERYKDYDNIIWLIGGDADHSQYGVTSKVEKIVQGIREYNPDALFTYHNDRGKLAADTWGNVNWLNVNNVYPRPVEIPSMSERAYELSSKKPFFMIEGWYENQNDMTSSRLRAQFYWTMLSGGFGHVFGNCPMWNFNAAPSMSHCQDKTLNWKGELDSEGTIGMTYAKEFFDSINWPDLVPDFDHNVLVSGYGTLGNYDYATAAKTSDNSMIVVYTPEQRTLRINTNILQGDDLRYRWYNPRTGTYSDYEDCNKGTSESFTPGGFGDWVLVVESNSGTPSNKIIPGNGDLNIYWTQDFEDTGIGKYDSEEIKEDWFNPGGIRTTEKIYIEEESGNKFMKNYFYAEALNGDKGFSLAAGGIDWYMPLPDRSQEEIYISYRMKFSDNMASESPYPQHWLSGKAGPGFYTRGTWGEAGNKPKPEDKGFMILIMFDGDYPRDSFNPDKLKLKFYVYHLDMSCTNNCNDGNPDNDVYWGSSHGIDYSFSPDVWYDVSVRLVLNTPRQNDGVLEYYVNGNLVTRYNNFRFRDYEDVKINSVNMANFLGGSGTAPYSDGWWAFDDFVVYNYG